MCLNLWVLNDNFLTLFIKSENQFVTLKIRLKKEIIYLAFFIWTLSLGNLIIGEKWYFYKINPAKRMKKNGPFCSPQLVNMHNHWASTSLTLNKNGETIACSLMKEYATHHSSVFRIQLPFADNTRVRGTYQTAPSKIQNGKPK